MVTRQQWEDLLFRVWLLKQRNLNEADAAELERIETTIRFYRDAKEV